MTTKYDFELISGFFFFCTYIYLEITWVYLVCKEWWLSFFVYGPISGHKRVNTWKPNSMIWTVFISWIQFLILSYMFWFMSKTKNAFCFDMQMCASGCGLEYLIQRRSCKNVLIALKYGLTHTTAYSECNYVIERWEFHVPEILPWALKRFFPPSQSNLKSR